MIKYSKTTVFLIIMALMMTLCFGCTQENASEPKNNGGSSNENTTDAPDTEEPDELTASDIAAGILANIEFEDQMDVISTDLFLGLYNLEEDDIAEAVVYESTGATAEEFAVIRTKDADGQSLVKAAVESRIEAQKNSFEDYVPKELDKLADPVIFEKDNMLIFIVCNDNQNAEKLLEGMNK